MKQVTQTLGKGVVEVGEVPVPGIRDTWVLVRNRASVISSGTEKTKIDIGRKNLLQKARARPDLVRQVLKKLRREGIVKTFNTVFTRLDSPNPLGYSSAGEVVAVGGLVEGIRPGDRVACAGAGYANHAELIAVPKNLVARLPDKVGFEEGSFATMGAIALQGLRLAEPRLGERFLVIGLGVLGQIAVQLLRANGCQVIGTDLDAAKVRRAEAYGMAGIREGMDPVEACMAFTEGRGVDGVLVCAGTASNRPIELCGEVARDQGRVVVVGAVRMDIPREPFFRKEISVVISRSYGPGRYDSAYEEGGHDYPFGYVRFTEKRNMDAFLELLSQGGIDVGGLVSHRFGLDHAPEAYGLIEGRGREPYLAILLHYDGEGAREGGRKAVLRPKRACGTGLRVSLFGAGNYATASLLPALGGIGVALNGLATASGRTARGVAERFGFGFCTDDRRELLGEDTDLLVIASRHDSHAELVVEALGRGRHVFVEKPLGLSLEELRRVDAAVHEAAGAQLMVGFNRRFSRLTSRLADHFKGVRGPRIVNVRVNAGQIPADHWIQDPDQGGGRLIGEGCHFIDLACALADDRPVSVHAVCTGRPEKAALLNDNVIITIAFAGGSAASVTYVADGSGAMAKERVEVFGGGRSAVMEDFRELVLYAGDGRPRRHRLTAQDKGQGRMLRALVDALKEGRELVPYEALALSSLATVCAVESMMIGEPVGVSLDLLSE